MHSLNHIAFQGQYQERLLPLLREMCNSSAFFFQKSGNICRACIANIQPNDFGRKAMHKTTLAKIGVLGNNYKAFLLAEIPNLAVIVAFQSSMLYMGTIWKTICEGLDKFWAQIFIKKELHTAEFNRRRSRVAAKARHARISSLARSGKSDRISSSLIPPAMYSRISYTVIRVPLTQGFPLRTLGFTTMWFSQFIVLGMKHIQR